MINKQDFERRLFLAKDASDEQLKLLFINLYIEEHRLSRSLNRYPIEVTSQGIFRYVFCYKEEICAVLKEISNRMEKPMYIKFSTEEF